MPAANPFGRPASCEWRLCDAARRSAGRSEDAGEESKTTCFVGPMSIVSAADLRRFQRRQLGLAGPLLQALGSTDTRCCFESVMCGMMMSAGPSAFWIGLAGSCAVLLRAGHLRHHERGRAARTSTAGNGISWFDQQGFDQRRQEEERGEADERRDHRELEDFRGENGVHDDGEQSENRAVPIRAMTLLGPAARPRGKATS